MPSSQSTDQNSQQAVQGGCQCGAVSYTLSDSPLLTYACHCTECQKRTGSAFAMGMVLPEASLDLQGELRSWQRDSDVGAVNTRYSCAHCGNIIYTVSSTMTGLIKLQPGTLADTRSVFADVHVWTRSAQPWVIFAENVPQFPTQPEDALEVLAAAQAYRDRRNSP